MRIRWTCVAGPLLVLATFAAVLGDRLPAITESPAVYADPRVPR